MPPQLIDTPTATPRATNTPTPPPTQVPSPTPSPVPTRLAAPVGLDIGNTAPNFTLRNLDGKSVSLSDFRGQIVLLNFWMVGNVFSRRELPDLQALLDENHNRRDVSGICYARRGSDGVWFSPQIIINSGASKEDP